MRLHNKVLFILVCSMVGPIATSSAYAQDDLNSEINNLQVELVKKPVPPTPAAKKKTLALKPASPTAQRSSQIVAPVWHKRVADNSISSLPPGPPPAPADAPRALDKRTQSIQEDTPYIPESASVPAYSGSDDRGYSAPTVRAKSSGGVVNFVRGFISDIEFKPSFNTSTLDGSARSNVVPSGVNQPVSFNVGGEISLDLNIGMKNMVLEIGGTYLRTGAQTGDAAYAGFNNFIYQDQETLGYAALPIGAKYFFGSSNTRSGIYAKAGIQPAYLLSHSYSSYSNYYDELRFGGYSQWDFMLTAGAGYTYSLNDHFQLVGEVSGYQGMIPVFATMNAYNVGFSTSVGLAYRL